MDLVKILAALLTKIFIRRAFGTEYANTRPVLPDLANVALNKKASNFVGKIKSCKNLGVGAVNGGRARVVFRATKAADCLVLVVLKVVTTIGHVCIFAPGISVGVVVLTAFASPA